MMLFDTTVGRRWSEEGTDSGIEEVLCCSHNILGYHIGIKVQELGSRN